MADKAKTTEGPAWPSTGAEGNADESGCSETLVPSTDYCVDSQDRLYECNLCDYVRSSIEEMGKHLLGHSGALVCYARSIHSAEGRDDGPLCPVTNSPLASPVEESIEEAKENTIFSCQLCEFQSAELLSVVEHITTHVESEVEIGHYGGLPDCQRKCSLCDHVSCSIEQMAKHLLNHSKDTSSYYDRPTNGRESREHSPQCQEVTSLLAAPIEETIAQPKVGETFTCHLCEFQSSTLTSIVSHIITHPTSAAELFGAEFTRDLDHPLSCTLCHYRCALPSELSSHMKLHNKLVGEAGQSSDWPANDRSPNEPGGNPRRSYNPGKF